MSKTGWDKPASGNPMAGLGMEAAIAPPTMACAVAVTSYSITEFVNEWNFK